MSFPPIPNYHPYANPDAIIKTEMVRFTVLTDRLMRLEYNPDNIFEDRPSQVFWYREQPVPQFEKRIVGKWLEIETEYLLLRFRLAARKFTRSSLSITLKQNRVTWQYGDSSRKAGNLKGTARTLDRKGGPIQLEDGLLSKSGWAVVDDSETLIFNKTGWLEPRTTQQEDLYFFGYGNDYTACMRDYTRVTGAIPLIPRYILGNWWSRYWEYTQDELKSLIEEFRSHDIPLSVCIIDMDWHLTKTGNASSGWTGYTWNRELFPDPQGFIAWLHEQGLRTALNLHPAKGIYPHEEQYEAMARWMGIDLDSKEPIPFDITNPHFMEGYFEILHHPQEENGIDFWWTDWQQGKKSNIPGFDPLWMLNHLHFYDLGRDGSKRPFVFSRWGGLGNHRYPIGFSGDTLVGWRALAFQPRFTATAANVAYGWWSHDIGGHMFKDKTPELYLRWVQFGVFSPIFRLHSTKLPTLERRPWAKPERIYNAAREAMQLRHALIPYIYSMAWRAHQTGISLVTPMYYGYMEETAACEAEDQYFFGSELFAAPITAPANPQTGIAVKQVWFPSGTWTNFFNGEQFTGECWQEIQATLEDIPVYAKAGAIVPLAPKARWGGIENPTELDIYIFPGADNIFELYEDDGKTTGYLQGQFAITRFSLEKNTFTIHQADGDTGVTPASRTYRIHLRGVGKNISTKLHSSYEKSTRTLNLEAFTLSPHESFTITFKKE